MSNLITWKQEEPKPQESMFDVLKGDNDAETYAYNIAAAEAEKKRLEAEAAAGLDNLTDSELEEQWRRAAAIEEAKTLPQRQIDAVLRFVKVTPELVLNQNNQNLIDTYFRKNKLDATRPEHFDEAYRNLSAHGLLDIDESKRHREPWRRGFSEAELEGMTDEQIRELAEGRR